MDQSILVAPDLSAAQKLLEAADRSGLRVEAAFWWLDEDQWKLIFATPLVSEQGPLAVYSRIRDLIDENSEALPEDFFERIEVVSPSAGVITVFDIGSEGKVPVRRLIRREQIRGVYVQGAYVYRFEPRTFDRAPH